MPTVIWAAFFPVAAYIVVITFPGAVLDLIDSGWAALVSLAFRWRSRLVGKYGQRAFKEVSRDFRRQSRDAGYDEGLIEEVLMERRGEICKHFGEEYVNDVFGELAAEDK